MTWTSARFQNEGDYVGTFSITYDQVAYVKENNGTFSRGVPGYGYASGVVCEVGLVGGQVLRAELENNQSLAFCAFDLAATLNKIAPHGNAS